MGIERIRLFLKTLEVLAELNDYELLSSPGYANSINSIDTNRVNKVMEYVMDNYMNDIHLEEAARIVNMNKSSFCRYFKLRTHKTFSEFMNEIRIAHACKLLANSDMTVTGICYKVGYNNISHFNRQFKKTTGMTAKEYEKTYITSAL